MILKKICSRFSVISILILCLQLTSISCVPLLIGGVIGAGTMVYFKGNLKETLPYPVDEVHAATLEALKKQGIFTTSDELSLHTSKIRAQYEDSQKIFIDIKAITENAAEVQIRVGTIGNKVRSELILEGIKSYLNMT